MSVLGIDIGGTNVRLVIIEADGTQVGQDRFPTLPERGVRETLAAVVQRARALMARHPDQPVDAVGVGVTGPVDVGTGILSNPFTLQGWPPTNLRNELANAFEAPCVVDNDANAAAVGEWWLGAGRGAARMTMVTIGTGIGVATLVDGRIQRTSKGVHGEAGHMVLNPFGPPCYCGGHGCWEVLASGTALDRAARALADDPESRLGEFARDGHPIGGELLFQAASAGDPAAERAVDEFVRWWGLGLVNLAATAMPDVIVLSGGVAQHFDAVSPGIRAVMERQARMIPVPALAPASLGELAGATGAAKMALDVLSGRPQA